MRFDIITLFPELITPHLQVGINRRAYAPAADGSPAAIAVHLHNPRGFATGNYRRVDDRPFGGGPGMVMLAEPLAQCTEHIFAQRQEATPCPVVLFSPIGQIIKHALVADWAQAHNRGAILVCGRYEGIDQRYIDRYVTQQLSLGDFVLSGGEIAAIALLDAIARLQDGVLGDAQSHVQDSFNPAQGGLLDCPHYTRPELWQDTPVPPVLLSGDHQKIETWRQAQREQLTQSLRPDLLA